MKRILVAGFSPFSGESINPSYEAIKDLPNQLLGFEIIKIEIETSFKTSHEKLIPFIDDCKPKAIILVGQAGGSKSIRVERVAINIKDSDIPDNDNQMPVDEPINKLGSSAYFSTLPIKKVVLNLMDEGFPAIISNSAGTFVCNHLMYHTLHHLKINKQSIPAGFIHVPYIFSQVIDKPNVYATDLTALTRALKIVITTVIQESLLS